MKSEMKENIEDGGSSIFAPFAARGSKKPLNSSVPLPSFLLLFSFPRRRLLSNNTVDGKIALCFLAREKKLGVEKEKGKIPF